MQDSKDDLTSEEREAFASLRAEKEPPPFLEDRTIEALKQAKLIHSGQRFGRWFSPQLGYGVAASLLFLFIGVSIGAWWKSKTSNASVSLNNGLPQFMLILRTSPSEPYDNSAEETQRVNEYRAWALNVQRQGLLVGGEKLNNEVRMLSAADGRPVVSRTQIDPKQKAIAGYFLIHARDSQQAADIAATCPHLRYGGTIEVRQIYRGEN